VIEVRGVSKRYGEFVAVRDVSFEVARGEVVGFLGPNGAGKTTTMRVLTGFLPATSGSVKIAGHDMSAHGPEGLEARRAIGYLPETPPLYPEMRVDDYLRFVARIKDVPRARLEQRVDKAVAACGLEDVRQRLIGRLSRGFRQRVGLAQAIVHEPEVLVLDEPTTGLDPIQMAEIRRLIRELAEHEGRTVILSTHILPEVEAICQRVLLISHGEIRIDGSLEEVVGQGTLEDVFMREAAPAKDTPPDAPADGAQV
jgi:ABC-2 type transport system ATP-binding protein